MPNIATLLKAEITRLSRREIKKEIAAVKKANVACRHHIAALKRQVAELEQKSTQFAKRAQVATSEPTAFSDRPVRFVAKGLVTLRKRLGLSASQLGRLIGVSEQSVYNWETKKAVPRKDAFSSIVKLRGLGKREVHKALSEHAPRKTLSRSAVIAVKQSGSKRASPARSTTKSARRK